MSDPLVPAEWNMSRAVPSLLHQGLVEFPAGTGVDSSPAIFTVILQTRHVSAEEGRKLAAAARALTLVAQLIVQDIWLNFHLQPQNNTVGHRVIAHSALQIHLSTPGLQQLCSRGCCMGDFPPKIHFNTSTPSLILWKNPRNQCWPSVSHLLWDLFFQAIYRLTPKPWTIMGVLFDAQLRSDPFRQEWKLFTHIKYAHFSVWISNVKHFISVFFPWLSPLSKRKSSWSCWDQMRGLTQDWCPPTLLALRARWWAGIQNSRNKYRYKFLL